MIDPLKTAFRLRVVPVSAFHQKDAPTRTIIEACQPANLHNTILSMDEEEITLAQLTSDTR